ncbi:MAG: DNA circularization N-terminal domain-containing protein [Actinomycetota bacterium]|nr:DNA circularization N-terminal domain-containing protein [Actinomycetota bacterium]
MADTLLPATFGSQRLWIGDITTDMGRSLVAHEMSRGDEFPLSDRGRRLRRAQAEVVFCDIAGERPKLERYRAFLALEEEGKPQIFIHPILGSYRARLGECTLITSADSEDIRLSVEIVPDEVVPRVFELGGGMPPIAGPEAVEVVSTQIEDLRYLLEPETTTVHTDAVATATAWTEAEEPDSRSVYLEVATACGTIDNEIARLELLADLDRWPLFKLFVELRDKVSAAGQAVAASTDRVFDLVVRVAAPLRVICARLYGASNADTRTEQIRRLNNLRTVFMVPAGTTLKAPVPPPGVRR